MCLTALGWKPSSRRPLLLAFNRDEYYNRPTEKADFWEDKPHIYGSRDKVMGGTWLACSTKGRMAALTNFHNREDKGRKFPQSRGEIPVEFCDCNLTAVEFAQQLEERKDDFKGFNVILFDGTSLVYCCNRASAEEGFYKELPPGVYGLSNHLLDTPWPKVEQTKRTLERVKSGLPHEDLVDIIMEEFTNPERVSDPALLPKTLGEDMERNLSAVFVQGPDYGTRTTTIVSFVHGRGFDMLERHYENKQQDLPPITTFQHIPCNPRGPLQRTTSMPKSQRKLMVHINIKYTKKARTLSPLPVRSQSNFT